MSKRSTRLTYEEVASLCDALNQQGIEPTQQKLMILLQRGSASTYTAFLQKWREEKSSKSVRIGNSLFRQITSLIEMEVERYSQLANEEIKTVRKELEKSSLEIQELQEKLKKERNQYEEQILEAEKRIKDLSNSLQAIIKDSDTLRRQFSNSQTERNRLEIQQAIMIEKRDYIENSLNEKSKAYDNLKNDHERLKDELSQSIRKINEMNIEYQLLSQSYNHQKYLNELADKECNNLQNKVGKLEDKLSILTAKAVELELIAKVSEAKLQSCEAENIHLRDETKRLFGKDIEKKSLI